MYGLPRLLTGSILAHECMHAWFVLNYIDCSGKAVNEGLSQLMALMWIEAQHDQVCLHVALSICVVYAVVIAVGVTYITKLGLCTCKCVGSLAETT